ncbi:hypothetical protein MRS44_005813 [Fusarium solani]|nr:hypothetical protein MRS44_005813 [Fusarium solani]
MACGTSSLVNRNGPGSAATSIAESIIKPAEATGTKTKCIECGDYECCCIPCTILFVVPLRVYFFSPLIILNSAIGSSDIGVHPDRPVALIRFSVMSTADKTVRGDASELCPRRQI